MNRKFMNFLINLRRRPLAERRILAVTTYLTLAAVILALSIRSIDESIRGPALAFRPPGKPTPAPSGSQAPSANQLPAQPATPLQVIGSAANSIAASARIVAKGIAKISRGEIPALQPPLDGTAPVSLESASGPISSVAARPRESIASHLSLAEKPSKPPSPYKEALPSELKAQEPQLESPGGIAQVIGRLESLPYPNLALTKLFGGRGTAERTPEVTPAQHYLRQVMSYNLSLLKKGATAFLAYWTQ